MVGELRRRRALIMVENMCSLLPRRVHGYIMYSVLFRKSKYLSLFLGVSFIIRTSLGYGLKHACADRVP